MLWEMVRQIFLMTYTKIQSCYFFHWPQICYFVSLAPAPQIGFNADEEMIVWNKDKGWISLRDGVKKKPDYLVTWIIFLLTPTHLPQRMTYDKND